MQVVKRQTKVLTMVEAILYIVTIHPSSGIQAIARKYHDSYSTTWRVSKDECLHSLYVQKIQDLIQKYPCRLECTR